MITKQKISNLSIQQTQQNRTIDLGCSPLWRCEYHEEGDSLSIIFVNPRMHIPTFNGKTLRAEVWSISAAHQQSKQGETLKTLLVGGTNISINKTPCPGE